MADRQEFGSVLLHANRIYVYLERGKTFRTMVTVLSK